MKPNLICATLLAAVALAAHADESVDVAASRLPNVALTPALMQQFLLAEIAGSRGDTALASDTYLKLAEATRDPRVAKRAAEVALYARRQEAALTAVRLWAQLEPESIQAQQMETSLLAAIGQPADLAKHISRQLAANPARVAPLLMQLNRLLSRGDDKQATRTLVDEVTAPYLDVAEAHFARAQAASGTGDTAAALASLDRALFIRPGWEHAAVVRAQLTPDPAAAVKLLREFVAANPDARDVRLAYARALVAKKDYAAARDQFDRLLAASSSDVDMIYAVAVLSAQLKDFDRAEGRFKELLSLDYADSNNVRIYLGQIAEERQRVAEALDWYGQVTSGGQYLAARSRAAHLLVSQNRLDEARKMLQEATAVSVEERAQLLILEAQIMREAGRVEDAYAVLDGGLTLRPDEPDLLYEAALTAEKLGRNDVLERNLRRLIEIKPDHAHAYNALGYSLADRNERLDEAGRLIDKALELAPSDPFILDSKGWLQFRRGEGAAALDTLTRAYAVRADPEIAAHIGEVLWSLGRQDEARKTWNEAIKGSPGNEMLLGTVKRFSQP